MPHNPVPDPVRPMLSAVPFLLATACRDFRRMSAAARVRPLQLALGARAAAVTTTVFASTAAEASFEPPHDARHASWASV